MEVTLNKNKLGGALLCILSLVILIVVMDLCLGGSSAWLYHRSKYGIFHRQQYILNESKDDIIILGSSRASHHYVPSIISDSLRMTCYNAGSEGMCIYYHYAILSAMIERGHCPKIVIYDVVNLDLIEHPGPTFTLDAALERLAPHYGCFSKIDSMYDTQNWKEKIKLYSLCYRYNSKLVQSIKCNFIPSPEDNGYEQVLGSLPNTVEYKINPYDKTPLDTLKMDYLIRLISLSKKNNVKLIMVMSPNFGENPSIAFDTLEKVARVNHVDYYNCYNEPSLMNRSYFRDMMHLNDEGAHVWSAYIAHLLKSELNL